MKPRILITGKISPDLDGTACAYAYRRLLNQQGQNTTEGIFGQPHVEAQYLIERFNITDINYSPTEPFDKFILVDSSALKGLPEVIRAEDVIEVIDHRKVQDAAQTFPNAKIQIEAVGAAATQITEKYQNAKAPIDSNSAILLYGAIYSNTLNLKAKVTTQRDKDALNWLKSQTQIPDNLIHDMFVAKTHDAIKELNTTLKDDFQDFSFGEKHIGITQLEVINLEQLIKDHLEQILSVLEELKQEYNLDSAFLTSVDLEKEFNLFVTDDSEAQTVLEKTFNIKFLNNVAKRDDLVLRKEIVPKLESFFEGIWEPKLVACILDMDKIEHVR